MSEPTSLRPGLIWAFDFAGGTAVPIDTEGGPLAAAGPPGGLRWLHLNLADQWTRRWIAEAVAIDGEARDLLLGGDRHQRALVGDTSIACLLHDFERDFSPDPVARIGVIGFALTASLMLSVRQHPLCAPDIVYERILGGACPETPEAAFDLLAGAILRVGSDQIDQLTATVQASEDALLERGRPPDIRSLFAVRRRAVLLRRQLGGLRGVLARLERDEGLPEPLLPAVERLAQRVAAMDGDVILLDSNLRQLREEYDVQTATRTNQNLYILSILTALLLPATLVTGFFGMNTGGMPWQHGGHGTFSALVVAVAASLAVYLWLARRGLFRD